MKENKTKKINVILGVMLVLCVSVIIIMLILWPRETNNNRVENEKVTTTIKKTDSQKSNDDMIEIKTPYCTLEYPKLWSDNLKYEEKDKDGLYSQTFYCNVKKQKIKMFTIYFGETEKGECLGYIVNGDEKVAFSVDVNSVETDGTWTQEEKNLLMSMNEGVNDVISSVTSNENFSEE